MERREEILAEARLFVREQLGSDTTGHDWWHVERVTNLARRLAGLVEADAYVCELAALLHDVADYKIAGDEATGLRRVSDWLEDRHVADVVSKPVLEIIATLSFAGGN